MWRLFAKLAAVALLACSPIGNVAAQAQPVVRGHFSPIRAGGPCKGIVVQVNFVQGLYCSNGAGVSNYAAIPGWTYTGAVSGTGATVRYASNADGSLVPFANNVPRITNQGILVELAATNSFLNSAVGATQTVTTTATSWTLSFYGTGSITSTGGASFSLSGTGANNRVSQTVTATAAPCVLTVAGSITNVQLEAGTSPTSYIPTTSAAVTRSADAPKIAGLITGSRFTWLARVLFPNPFNSGFPTILQYAGEAGMFASSGQADYNGAGVNATIGPPVSAGTVAKIAVALGPNDFQGAVNGVLGTPITSGVTPTTTGTLAIGSQGGTNLFWNGYIQSIGIVGSRLPNAQLQARTR